jgi:hypothetical protein
MSRLIADFVADHAGRARFAVSIALSASLFVAAAVVWSSVFVTAEVASSVWFVVTSLPSRHKGIVAELAVAARPLVQLVVMMEVSG